MSFEQTNTDSCSANNLVYFPKSLLSLEIADGSVTADVLDWLSTCCQEICQSNPTKIFLRELTLSYETCLANDLNVWKSFLSLLDKSLMNLHKVTLNHCGLTDDQSRHLTDLVNSKECCSPFKSFIINQNELTLSNDTGCCCFFRIWTWLQFNADWNLLVHCQVLVCVAVAILRLAPNYFQVHQ